MKKRNLLCIQRQRHRERERERERERGSYQYNGPFGIGCDIYEACFITVDLSSFSGRLQAETYDD